MSKITRQNFIKNLVLITGLTRSGKTMLAPIISSMKRVEHVAVNYLMEQIPMSHILGLIPDETAFCLMRYAVDTMFYDYAIGRNLNLRFGDLTSAWKTSRPFQYLKRLFAKEGDAVLESIVKNNPIYLLMVHDALWHADVYFKSFPEMKMIHITRHPVSMAYNWYKKGYGADFFENPRNATLTLEWESKQLPYYAAGWEKEYLNMPEIDRVINMIKRLEDSHSKKYNSLSDIERHKVYVVPFEKALTDSEATLKDISAFIGTELTKHTSRICKRERCPRQLRRDDIEKELSEIRSLSSEEGFKLLELMSEKYDEIYLKDVVFV